MKLKTGFAFLGSLVGVGLAVGLYFLPIAHWISLCMAGGLSIIGYIVTAAGAAPTTHTTRFGEYMRGLLIGLNAGMNGLILFVVLDMLGARPIGIYVGIVLGLINYQCTFGPISQNEVYQGFVGWTSWLMPMSWPIVALGLTFVLFSLLMWGVTFGQVDFLSIKDAKMDWKTGTFFIKGGLVANLNYAKTAFNMGNFSFTYKTSNWHLEHEAGHTLNLTAFGSLFHFMGALDENVVPARHQRAFAERLADSNKTATGINIPMWA